jgi:putative DNA primase/helicase
MESEDAITLWLNECTTEAKGHRESSAELFKSWKEWCEAAGEYPGTRRRFSQNLEAKGLVPERKTEGRGYNGRRLNEKPWDLSS